MLSAIELERPPDLHIKILLNLIIFKLLASPRLRLIQPLDDYQDISWSSLNLSLCVHPTPYFGPICLSFLSLLIHHFLPNTYSIAIPSWTMVYLDNNMLIHVGSKRQYSSEFQELQLETHTSAGGLAYHIGSTYILLWSWSVKSLWVPQSQEVCKSAR